MQQWPWWYKKEAYTRVVLIVAVVSSLHRTLTISDNGRLGQAFILPHLAQHRPICLEVRKGLQLECPGCKGASRPGQRGRADRSPARSPSDPQIV